RVHSCPVLDFIIGAPQAPEVCCLLYNVSRIHRWLNKDAPFHRATERVGAIAFSVHISRPVLAIVREDAVCRRLITVPGVGPVVAVTFKSTVDDPSRIAKSKAAGALFGLTPKKYQSGEKDVTGGTTRTGDEMVRTALYEAANVLLSRITRF